MSMATFCVKQANAFTICVLRCSNFQCILQVDSLVGDIESIEEKLPLVSVRLLFISLVSLPLSFVCLFHESHVFVSSRNYIIWTRQPTILFSLYFRSHQVQAIVDSHAAAQLPEQNEAMSAADDKKSKVRFKMESATNGQSASEGNSTLLSHVVSKLYITQK